MSGRRAWWRSLATVAGAAVLWCALAALPARGADTEAALPDAHGYVNDLAGVLPEDRRAQLESFLDQLDRKTGAQFAVLTVDSCDPEEPDAYKVRVFQKWGLGRKGNDENSNQGLLLLAVMSRHRLVFETGYGLEGTLPDGWEASMLRDLAVPRFKQGQVADGLTAAVLAASQRIAAAKGVTLQWNGQELRYDQPAPGRGPHIPMMLVAFVIFFIFTGIARSLGFRGGYVGPWIGGGWGGGFGGGGGGGSSFGGFGGGASGGGGGGASW
jgi:uncharacterized protein